MKHLDPDQQNILLMALRHRAEYWRRLKRVKAFGKIARHGLLIAACSGGLFTAGIARAADAPSAVSAPGLFNEANADLRAGRTGAAILNYERASFLAPNDKAIAGNLLIARQKAVVAAPSVPTWQRPAHCLGFDAMTGLAGICLLLFSLLFFGTRLIPTTLRTLARCTASLIGMVALFAASSVVMRWPELDRAVVVGSHSTLHIAPAIDAAASFELKPGELVREENTYGNFVRIRAADGHSGWVIASEVEKIIPATS